MSYIGMTGAKTRAVDQREHDLRCVSALLITCPGCLSSLRSSSNSSGGGADRAGKRDAASQGRAFARHLRADLASSREWHRPILAEETEQR
jgi:hypothetical protein